MRTCAPAAEAERAEREAQPYVGVAEAVEAGTLDLALPEVEKVIVLMRSAGAENDKAERLMTLVAVNMPQWKPQGHGDGRSSAPVLAGRTRGEGTWTMSWLEAMWT